MKQYEFSLIKQSSIHTVYCTSQNPDKALASVQAAYAPEFEVKRMSGEFPPHRFYAEIDATR